MLDVKRVWSKDKPMSDHDVAMMEVTGEERQFIELLRQARDTRQQKLIHELSSLIELIKAGDEWPDRALEYLEVLVDAEALVREVEQNDSPDEGQNPEWRDDLRQGLIDAAMGKTRPASELLAELNDDDPDDEG
jgi:hypothetical protein